MFVLVIVYLVDCSFGVLFGLIDHLFYIDTMASYHQCFFMIVIVCCELSNVHLQAKLAM